MECEGYRKRGRCKVVMWCDTVRAPQAVLQLYESTVDSPPAHPAAVPLYSCTRASSDKSQQCTAVHMLRRQSLSCVRRYVARSNSHSLHGLSLRQPCLALYTYMMSAGIPDVGVAVSSVPRAPTDVASPRRHLQAHTSVMKWSFE